jgi:cyclic pyranopterin phosphate synthase
MPGTIDISEKGATVRRAVARSILRAAPEAIEAVRSNDMEKQDPIPTARAAGMLAVKETPRILPHCHPIAVTDVKIDFEISEDSIEITCRVTARDRTGTEMEALVGASTAALTLYDMIKPICAGAVIRDTRLLEKEGGKSGHWLAKEKRND